VADVTVLDRLDEAGLRVAVDALAERDPDLAAVITRHGHPPLWGRPPCYTTLIRIILEQQVSLASAKATYDKLTEAIGEPTPEAFLTLGDEELKGIGFSRQKTRYVRLLSEEVLGGLDLAKLDELGDEEARGRLMALKGVGRWSADIFLLMALKRPDVWPRGDLALVNAIMGIKGLPRRPTEEEWDALAEPWRPYRSVAARIAWFEYLGGRP
jgi:DNA-3-methyladenine glycosylase II